MDIQKCSTFEELLEELRSIIDVLDTIGTEQKEHIIFTYSDSLVNVLSSQYSDNAIKYSGGHLDSLHDSVKDFHSIYYGGYIFIFIIKN